MSEVCPVCFKQIAKEDLLSHVNSCLDGQNEAPSADEAWLEEMRQYEEEKRRQEEENERLFREFLKKEQEEEELYKRTKLQEQSFVCPMCKETKKFEELFFLEYCAHFFCKPCLQQFIVSKIYAMKCSEIICTYEGCKKAITQAELKQLLTPKDYDAWTENSVKEVISSNPNMFVQCPKCSVFIEKMAPKSVAPPTQLVLGHDGKPLSPEALEHRENHRFRCRECDCDFCGSCKEVPYHLGFTCEQFVQYQHAGHCRFCSAELRPENTAPKTGWPKLLWDCCTDQTCLDRRALSCRHQHKCGHPCIGINSDDKFKRHPPCLHPDCVKKNPSEALPEGSDYCNICWVESLQAAPCLRLDCGHYFHYECVRKKIINKWAGAMITFGFLDCPLCKKQISHPALEPDLKPILQLYDEVKKKALQRLKYMNLENAAELKDKNTPYYNNPERYALARFCYYPCYVCKRPYFGGMKECNAEQRVADFNPEDLVCGSCSSAGSENGHCPKHGAEFIEYKCRFCCQVAVWFCWGTTHFCNDCHQQAAKIARKPKNLLPPCTCHIKHPPNGEEFCLGCSVCRFDAQF